MDCDKCNHWTTQRKTAYDDGSEISTYDAPACSGHCSILTMETAADFGCKHFAAMVGVDHIALTKKSGSPWHHFVMVPCPECRGNGSTGGACRRCAGTANVRKYDDGHVGEEQTRTHPKELELGRVEPPKCIQCSAVVDAQWIACPMCGNRLRPVAKTEQVDNVLSVT